MDRFVSRICIAAACSALLLGALPSVAKGLTVSPTADLPSTQSYKEDFSSDGQTVVYTTLPPDDDNPYGRIAAYDIATRTERIVSESGRNAAVSGDTVVYSRMTFSPMGPGELCAYDLKTGTERVVASSGKNGFEIFSPEIDGDIAVYTVNIDRDILGVNISTGETFTVSTNGWAPDIAGNWVVYQAFATKVAVGGGTAWQNDIKAYNIATKKTYTLCSNSRDQSNPHISSTGIVVWDDERNAPDRTTEFRHTTTDVYGCSVYNRTNFAVAGGAGCQNGSSIYGNLVVYYDSSTPSGYHAMGKDMLAGTRFGIVPRTKPLTGSAISGGLLVYGQLRMLEAGAVVDLRAVQPAILEVTEALDAYRDSVAASQEAFPDGCDEVTIAGASSWASDLAAASFTETDQPLLLTRSDSLPDVVRAELRRLGATHATVIGGSSVSAQVQSAIASIIEENRAEKASVLIAALDTMPAVERIGGDRYSLADSVARRVASRPGWDGTVLVASGTLASHAMPAVSLTVARTLPVILASPDGLSKAQLTLLKTMGVKRAVIIGSKGAVPSKAGSQLVAALGSANVRRLAGDTVYGTAALVAEYGVASQGMRWNGLQLASTKSFANVITGGLRNGASRSVLMLTNGSSLSSSTSYRPKLHRKAVRKASYLGDSSVLDRDVRRQVRAILH